MAYLKAGIYAKAGAGKSYTATSIAIGLYKYAKLSKPVAWLDTETGSDFLLPRFKAEGIELFVAKTRSFQDLLAIIDEAEKGCSILIIDSITHPWNELVDSYLAKNELKRLRLKDWQPIKKTWREFTDRYLQSKLHIIVCGRSADEWQEIEDTEDGSLELKKVGTKMKTETEMGHEPSLLIEMEAIQLTSRTGSNYIHRAYVKKDRWDIINGKMFDDPKFEDFLPAIAPLNLGGEHKALEPGRNSTDMFEKGNTGEQRAITRDIFVEKIANEIKLLYPGQSEADKVGRLKLMNETFGTNSWVEIEKRVYMEKLEAGFSKLKALNKAGHPVSAKDEAKPKPKKGGTK
jgi:hypothetical protein